MAQNILKEAKKGTRIYNQTHDIFYIYLGGGKWQKDDEFTSQWRRWGQKVTGRLKFDTTEGAATIKKDGTYNVTERIFTITDGSNPNIAESLRGMEKGRVQLRIEPLNEKKLKQYNALIKNQKESIEFYEKQYPHLKGKLENIFNEAHASGNPKEYLLKNYNLHLGLPSKTGPSQFWSTPTPTGKISPYYFDRINTIANLGKELNINQPEEIKGNENQPDLFKVNGNNTNNTGNGTNNTGNGTNGKKDELLINQNLKKDVLVASTDLKGILNNGKESNNDKEINNQIVVNGKNGSNKKDNLNSTGQRFSWEKDLNSKQAKELQNIRNVFGDYRKELNINKRTAGSNMNRRRLTGPMDQHTAEMLGLL